MQNTLFEWVINCNGQEFYLTDAQHDAVVEGQNERFIKFKDFMINPAFISYSFRRPAEELMKRYPCNNCLTSGYMADRSECPECKGTGVLLPK